MKPLENIVPTISGADLTFSHGCPAQLKEGEECFLGLPPADGGRHAHRRTARDQQRRCARAAAVRHGGGGADPAAGVVAFSGSVDGNFGTVARGGTKTPRSHVVQNIGNAADAITVTGPTGSGWSFSEDCPDTLAVGSSCNLSISVRAQRDRQLRPRRW